MEVFHRQAAHFTGDWKDLRFSEVPDDNTEPLLGPGANAFMAAGPIKSIN